MAHLARSALYQAALNAAARGWHVFPLKAGQKRPALHGAQQCLGTLDCANGHKKWEQRASTNPRRIQQCWELRNPNVAIATGPSGLVVIDLDVPKNGSDAPDGATTFQALCERAGKPWPTTYTVRTASGGQHLYFTAPDGQRLPSSAGKLGPGVDTRAWGGYVVAPGSTVDIRRYEVTTDVPPVPLPGWLTEALTTTVEVSTAPAITPPRNATRCAQVALERECDVVENAAEGEREATLFKAARAMGRFVAWGDIARHEVEEAFQAAGEACGLKPYECRSTLRSALNWSIRTARPRGAA